MRTGKSFDKADKLVQPEKFDKLLAYSFQLPNFFNPSNLPCCLTGFARTIFVKKTERPESVGINTLRPFYDERFSLLLRGALIRCSRISS
jgi:hypothetical protein